MDRSESDPNREMEVVAVTLVHESCGKGSPPDTQLGVVTVEKSQWTGIKLNVLRDRLALQLSMVLPHRFLFCTKSRHSISRLQEKDVKVSQIIHKNDMEIYISHEYEKPKSTIREFGSDNEAIGHVFCSYGTSLSQLRILVDQELPYLAKSPEPYQFLSSNKAPVHSSAEFKTFLSEILCGHSFYVVLKYTDQEKDVKINNNTIHPAKRKPENSIISHSTERTKALRLSFSSSKDTEPVNIMKNPVESTSKQLLISYVRAEAAEHALNLKKKLTDLGFSVYLDVHEIKSGIDWQDSLNYAVSNCEVFVPLVTPRYGETQWTNREVKLADMLGKPILPISFLEEWPPRCLAIQFATTQFIHWKTPRQIEFEISKGSKDARDIRQWDCFCIATVAREIELRIKTLKIGPVSMSKPALTRMKTLIRTFAGRLPKAISPVVLNNQDSDEPTGPQVVICAHPHEAKFGLEIESWLEEKGHSVWLSAVKDFNRDSDTIEAFQGGQQDEQWRDSRSMSPNNSFGPVVPQEYVQQFQDAVDKAYLIIVIISKAFTKSKTCRQQIYYCEHRKRILPVKCDDFKFPAWLNMLIRTQTLVDAQNPSFQKMLMAHVERQLDPTAKNCLESESQEVNINAAVQHLKQSLQVKNCVYVAGAPEIADARSEATCRAIAVQLSNMNDLTLVTGGGYGVSQLVGEIYHQEMQRQFKQSSVWHILPERDAQDMTQFYSQCSDGSFSMMPFGKTIFCGGSVWERDAIVGRCFPICLLIEGGPSSAHQVEEFVWSDHVVVPVNCSNGVAGGDVKVTDKMYQLPMGVSEVYWKCLNEKSTPTEELGVAASHVVQSLRQSKLCEEDNIVAEDAVLCSSVPTTAEISAEEDDEFDPNHIPRFSNHMSLRKSKSPPFQLRSSKTVSLEMDTT